jgi:hypothetical protein
VSITFPNVPNLPGVPQLARAALPNENTVLVTAGGLALSSLFGLISTSSQWGIFNAATGAAVFVPDSILEFEHHPRWRISDFPIQGTGATPTAFASYNKVKLPFDCRVRMSKGSTLADRANFLTALDAAANTLDLYNIMTPEYSYQNCNIEYYDVVRSTQGLQADGAFFLTEVDVYFKQIVVVTAQYSTTALLGTAPPFYLDNATNPSALPSDNLGTVLPQDPPTALATQAGNASLAGAFGAFS